MNKRIRLISFLLTSGFFLFLDRIVKQLSLYCLSAPDTAANAWGWRPYLNPGVAFGIPLPNFLIIPFSILIIILIIYLISRSENTLPRLALCLALSGAVSNLFDRLFFGKTIDYFIFFNAIFNLADIMIVAGFSLFIFSAWRDPRKPAADTTID